MSGVNAGVAFAVALVFCALAWMNVEEAKSDSALKIAQLHCAAVAK